MDIRKMLAGESKNVEFKESRPESSERYMKTVVAFANGKGGNILFGVSDDRKIVGIPNDILFREMDAIANAISDSCEPVIIPDIYPQTVDGKTVIVAEIESGKQKPYYIKSEGITEGVYIRVAGTSRKADRTIAKELYFDSEGRSYDSQIRRDVKVNDAQIEQLCADMKAAALKNCKNKAQKNTVRDVTKNVLLSWGILAEDSDGIVFPTNAFIILTGTDSFLSKIQCAVFKGRDRSVFVDKREYGGSLWEQAEEAYRFVLRNIRMGARIEGIYRIDQYEFPPDSIRELIMNAVMNCSFLQSSHIQVSLFDDRLEITSPGGLMPGVTVSKMKEGYSQIRNRALANAFAYMNLIEGWGTGIPRLMKEMEAYGLAKPEFIEMEETLRINLYRAILPDTDESLPDIPETLPDTGISVSESAGFVPDTDESVPDTDKTVPDTATSVPDTSETLPDTDKSEETEKRMSQQRCIYEAVLQKGSITSADAAVLLNVGGRRSRDILKRMVDMGLLKKEGSARSTFYVQNRKERREDPAEIEQQRR